MFNIIDHLVFRAKIEPNAIAIQRTDCELTFAQLLILVRRVANKFREEGVTPGEIVVTNIPDKMLDWILTLALVHESVVTCSNNPYRPIPQTIKYNWIVTDKIIDTFDASKAIIVDEEWYDSLKYQSYDIFHSKNEQSVNLDRILMTSGTTGIGKAVTIPFDSAVERAKNSLEFTTNCNSFVSLFGLSSGLGLNNAIVRLIKGLPMYCYQSGANAVDLINKYSIEGIHGSVVQIAEIIKNSININQVPPSLKVIIYAGSSASPAFLDSVSKNLTSNIYNDFGSTETAGICTFKPNSHTTPLACGYLYPDAAAEVVGESDEPLPYGEEGLLRFKRPYMVNGYYNDPLTSSEFFRDGWFYSGDRGRLMNDGLLILTGRNSELINRGGIKIDPVSIDQYLVDYPGVEDAATFGFINKIGVQDIAVAMVIADSFDLDTLKIKLLEAFGGARYPSYFIKLNKVPRNEMGKVMRGQLSKQFAQLVKSDMFVD